MNLDDLDYFKSIDPVNMLGHVDGLPDQLEAAWALGQGLPMPDLSGVTQVVFAGVGGSMMGAALLVTLLANQSKVGLTVWCDYDLPIWVQGPQTLVVAVSHSGKHEEALSLFKQAMTRGVKLLAITPGGPLAELCTEAGGTVWAYSYAGPPRAALGYSLALPLALLSRTGWIADKASELAEAATAMREQQKSLRAESPVMRNPAKRMAGQFMDRNVVVLGAAFMGTVARRWKMQVSENAKAWAVFEELPEMNYNSIVGITHPEAQIMKTIALFLESDFDHPRNKLRTKVTRELMMTAGFNTDVIRGVGPSALAQVLTNIHYGDYVSYYLAMAYGVDPSPVEPIDAIRERMAEA
jgi:glucose/mannose-6-phosphate isomerase